MKEPKKQTGGEAESRDVNVRLLALRSLLAIEKGAKYSNLEIDAAIGRHRLAGLDRAFFTSLVYGVIERRLTLDYILSRLSDRGTMDADVKMILRMGLCQLLYFDRVPAYSAVNESVNLCKSVKKGSASPFVNAVLRRFLREKDSIVWPSDPVQHLSVFFSVSPFIARTFLAQYGRERTEAILQAMGKQPPLTLRVNTINTAPEPLAETLGGEVWEQNGVRAVRLEKSVPLSELTCLSDGRAFVQDMASQICVETLGAEKGERILDACACPGGKSFGTAIRMGNVGSVLSCDLHENKLSLIAKGAQTLGLSIIETRAADGAKFEPSFENAFDRVLCDVPCSGLGVFAKKPDIRYKEEKDVARLPAIQSAILENVSRYVKRGGVLIYSTCTLHEKENEGVTSAFLASHSEFEKESERTFFPDTDSTDGFYVCRMRRKT
ncbi:MAG: 16S rRNA (cytosine(967)-C(5))-methyltransferase RsmB [Ruminococcaceae bacterium]|nr:16S rRNA (cytosine(967)-C(5))-methyltransferase RsmB [Oscillospiraceae bacterium]